MTDPVERAAVREMFDKWVALAWQPMRADYRKVFNRWLDALPAVSLEGPAWQPIATHPHNRCILVWFLNELGMARTLRAAFYDAGHIQMSDDCDESAVDENGSNVEAGWFEEVDSVDELTPLDSTPLFWMPLPSPPAQATAEKEGQRPYFYWATQTHISPNYLAFRFWLPDGRRATQIICATNDAKALAEKLNTAIGLVEP